MTYEEREAIFAKEALNNEDFQALFGVCRTEATNIMMAIKRKTGDRLGVKGKLHVQDYLDYFGLKAGNRYSTKESSEAEEKEKALRSTHILVANEQKKEEVSSIPLIKSSALLGV